MNEEQKRILSHLKYMQGLDNDSYLEKALKLIDELAKTVEDLKEEIKECDDLLKSIKGL